MKPNLVIIFGPPAVGKMTVGHELAKLTGCKLMHNHLSLELSLEFFEYGHESQTKINEGIKALVFEEVANSPLPGLIYTMFWAFDVPSDYDYADRISKWFIDKGGTIYYVELETDLETRLKRNTTPFRLSKKASKRDKVDSEKRLLEMGKHRGNTNPDEFTRTPYLKINNTKISAKKTAEMIKETFKL